jgi:hypothetical protein
VPRDTTVPAMSQATCLCGLMINFVPFTGDSSVMIPVDVDTDPEGSLVLVGSRAGFTIRPVAAGEAPEGRFRRRAHWDVCPHAARWRDIRRVVAGSPTSAYDPARVGPCARCGERHPWHYGGPVSSPVCDRCRAEKGEPLLGE